MDNSHRGMKRKRYEPPEEDSQVKLAGKLHHDLKEVRKAAKKAKTFETQKLVKKLKGIRKHDEKSPEIADLEAQLGALKQISHELVANTVLKTRLNKDRILCENEHVRAAASNDLVNTLTPSPSGTPAAKCENRLLSSKILAAEVAVVVEGLRNLLQPRNKENNFGVQDEDINPIPRATPQQVLQQALQGAHLKSTRLEDQVQHTEDALPLDKLAESDTEEVNEAGWESGTIDDNVGGDQESDSSVDSDSDDDTEERAAPSRNKPSKKSIHSNLSSSTFLPSLSVGFVRGMSDDSDMGERGATAGDIDFKKNRRGQRARRAIWEKKYGRDANHRKKEFEHRGVSGGETECRRSDTTFRQHRDAPSRKPVDTAVPRARHKVVQGETLSARIPTQGHQEDRSLHPSWEAKRKLKEKESASIVPSRGKKIKFS